MKITINVTPKNGSHNRKTRETSLKCQILTDVNKKI